MQIWIDIIAALLGVVGLLGCVVPVLPGPPLSWAGLLVLYIWGPDGVFTTSFLLVWLAVTVLVTVLDYVVPSYFTRASGGSKAAGRGSLAGLFVGLLFFPPLGMILGSFLGALLAEMFVEGKNLEKSIKPALGSFAGFLCGTFMKLAVCWVMMYHIVRAMF